MDPLPPPSKPEKKQGAPEGKNSEIESLINALIDVEKANGDAESAERKRNHKRETRHFWLTAGEIILVAVYAFFTVLEWRTFDSERLTMEQEFKTAQTNAVIEQKASQRQAKAAEDQSGLMLTNGMLDERAWVLPDASDAVFDEHFSIFSMPFRNFGKTPAIDVRAYITVQTNINNLSDSDNFPPDISRNFLAPTEGFHLITGQATAVQLMEIRMGKSYWIEGTARYKDIFKYEHWSQFCYRINPGIGNGTQWQMEGLHNRIDDVQP